MNLTPSEATGGLRIEEPSTQSGAPVGARRSSSFDVVLTAVTVASVGASLAIRVIHRGPYYPGWDVVGAANGLYLLSTRSVGELLSFYAQHKWQPQFWNTTGIPVALLPGWVASLWPWERWMHVITPCLTASSLWLVARALSVPLRAAWMVLLPLGASPALLSYAVMGLPYISNTLPHALALWVVFRCRDSIVGTVLFALVAIALSWQVQELGRTAFIVFVAAARTLPAASWRIRVVWLVVGGAWCGLAMTYPTGNTARHAGLAMASVPAWPKYAWDLALHFAQSKPDHPILLLAGLVAALTVPGDRWFWSGLLAAHVALIFVLATSTGETQGLDAVWPRRVLLLSFVALAACAAALRQRRVSLTRFLVAVLVAGNVWQVWTTVQWVRRPVSLAVHAEGYTLPFTYTPLKAGPVEAVTGLDSQAVRLLGDWHAEMREELASGRKLLLVYNMLSFDENATNPAGIIDRLYLGLGHERFGENVYVFGRDRLMVRELPIRPLQTFEEFVTSIDAPSRVRGYWLHHPKDENDWSHAKRHREEVVEMFAALERHFRLDWGQSSRDFHGRALHRFTLHPRAE